MERFSRPVSLCSWNWSLPLLSNFIVYWALVPELILQNYDHYSKPILPYRLGPHLRIPGYCKHLIDGRRQEKGALGRGNL